MRYTKSKIVKNHKGKRILESIELNTVPKSAQDTFIKPSSNERLDKIAYQYYGDTNYWWVIALVNNLGKGTLYVPQNMTLRLPYNPTEIMDRYINNSEL